LVFWLSLITRNSMPILIRSKTKEAPLWQERLIFCGMFLISSLFFLYTAQDLEQEFRLNRHGIFTEGTALRGERMKEGYAVYYKFNYNGLTFQAMSDAKESWLNSTKFPTSIRVHFLASDPNISRVPEVREYSLLWLKILFCPFFGLGTFALGANIFQACCEILEARKAKRKGGQPWDLPTYPKAWH
jgi:hypothetical protein